MYQDGKLFVSLNDEEVDTLLYEKTETVGFARTTVDGNDGDVSDKIWC